MKLDTRGLMTAALFTALITVGALIKIPLYFVPVTLQFFFVNLAILALERPWGAFAILAYLLLGLLGLPVFSGGGGPGYVLMPSFGYILGFLTAALISGRLKGSAPSLRWRLTLSALNIGVIHLVGLSYWLFLSRLVLGSPIPLGKMVLTGSLIFLPGDATWAFLSAWLAGRIPQLRKA